MQPAVCGLLAIHALLLVWGAAAHSPTYDEVAYLPAGISHWQLGRFDLASVSPPLVRLVAAAPVVLMKPTTDWQSYDPSPSTTPAHRVGRDFVRANGQRSFRLFTVARWACIPFSLIGGWVCYQWARDLYGDHSGLLACVLWCFSPNILAHGQLMTPDLGTTALGIAAAYTYWRWLKAPTWPRALAAGLVLGLAELAKTTLLIFILLWPVLWIVSHRSDDKAESGVRRECVQLAMILVGALYLLNLGYGFQGTGKQLGQYSFTSRALSGRDNGQSGNRFVDWGLAAVHVPLPESYLRGLDFQKRQLENPSGSQRSYLRGVWQDRGWWYYYLYALAIKVPLGTWLLAALAVLLWWLDRGVRLSLRDELVLLLPPLVILTLVSAQTGFNHHMRYVLPMFPFVFIAISRAGRAVLPHRRRIAAVASIAVVWSVGSSLWVYPHSLSYFNELVGGPRGGHEHLIDSNIDWGQDLFYLREWIADHAEASPLSVAYFGNLPAEVTGLDVPLPPGGGPTRAGETDFAVPREPEQTPCDLGPRPGWYAVSVNYLRGVSYGIARDLRYFQRFTPVARAGYSILIYHITEEQADRVRADSGLPLLRECGNATE